MESGKYAIQGTVVSNIIQPFLMVMVSLKYSMWQGTMASATKIWDVK